MTKSHALQLAIPILILIVTTLLYWNTLHASFHFDDFRIIVENPAFNFSTLSVSALTDVMASAPSRAVTMTTFALNYAVGGEEVLGYHVVNVLLHGLTGIAFYLLLWFTLTATPGGMIGLDPTISPRQIAGWTSLLWVVHPIQTQAVTYIVQRASALAALFYLLTMLCYLKGRLSRGRARLWWYLIGIFMAGLAMGSKETAITLPLALWFYEACFFTPSGRSPFRARLKTLLFVLAATGIIAIIYVFGVYGGVRPLITLFSGTSHPYQDFGFWQRILTKGRVVVFYLSLLLLPMPNRLNIDHDMVPSLGLWSPVSTLPAWVIIGATVILAMRLIHRHRLIGFWLCWFFLNIALESSIVGNDLVFEHRLYLPSMGFVAVLVVAVSMMAAWVAATRENARWHAIVALGMLGPLLIGYCAWTIERNRVWTNEVTLWKDAVQKSPGKFRPHVILGYADERGGYFPEAEQEYQAAKRLAPSAYWSYYDLGWLYYKQQRWTLAEDELERALTLELSPHVEALIRQLLGKAYAKQGRASQAVEQWERAYRLEPDLTDLAENLGWAYVGAERWSDARAVLQRAVTLQPGSLRARYYLGRALEHLGEMDQARLQYRHIAESGSNEGNFYVNSSLRRLETLNGSTPQSRPGRAR